MFLTLETKHEEINTLFLYCFLMFTLLTATDVGILAAIWREMFSQTEKISLMLYLYCNCMAFKYGSTASFIQLIHFKVSMLWLSSITVQKMSKKVTKDQRGA